MKEKEKNTPAAVASASRKKNRMLHLLAEMWPAYIFEIIVIILGISITLVLEEWRDSSKEEELAKVYRTNLSADVEADRQSLRYSISGSEELLAKGEEIRQFLKDADHHPLTAGQLNADVRALVARPKFDVHDATFSDLKSSGNLHLFKDVSLKALLFAYYSKTENIRDNQEAEQQATIQLSGRYFLQWFALDDSDDAPAFAKGMQGLSKNIEFRNHLLARVGTRGELLTLYRQTDSLAVKLLEALRK